MGITRREFIGGAAAAGIAAKLGAAGVLVSSVASGGAAFAQVTDYAPEVPYYDKLENRMIQCRMCPKECRVGDAERGFCGNKENRGGKYVTLAYGHPCALNNDPIEKKPLFHFLPGTNAISLAEAGCNFDCKFCQNWQISQARPEQVHGYDLMPADVVALAARAGSPTIAYTYGEPTVFYKSMYDTAALGKEKGIRSVMISNGYINPEPMKALCGVLDAVKVDFKAYSEAFYSKQCLGHLKPVLDTLVLLRGRGMWFELVYLMIPTLNDDPDEIKEMAGWIMDNLGPDVPMHFSRFHPQYKLKNLQPTPLKSLERARDICMGAGMNFVYIGNVPGHAAENTYCPNCGGIAIKRYGYVIQQNNVKNGKCGSCGYVLPGVWI
ncbi:MAG TPA: AmmeMemoRadiSam system radical SAM enzyme [bacterium]|nr:AmmeMemoRadiSam system radical SAM enzyme [bacterium]